jgi:KDO2-lipid IV(A) lauroyltransferase
LPSLLRKIIFELLYPIYLLKFRTEKKYISERLKKAGLQIEPKDVYKSLFFNALDSLKFLQNKKVPVRFENFNLIQSKVGKAPIVFASIHLGAFEMLHRGLAQMLSSSHINLAVSEFRNKKLNMFLTKTRAIENIKIVRDFEIPKVFKNAIRNREIIAAMADQSKHGGENFEILGQNIPLFLELPLKANKLGASVVLFRTFKKNEEHVIKIEQIYEPYSEINPREIAKIFETWILEYPEQWAWNYRRNLGTR